MATVIRLLRLADEADPGVLTAPVQARLGYSTSLPSRRGRPLNAYPMPGAQAIQQAALADARAIRERIDERGAVLRRSYSCAGRSAAWLADRPDPAQPTCQGWLVLAVQLVPDGFVALPTRRNAPTPAPARPCGSAPGGSPPRPAWSTWRSG